MEGCTMYWDGEQERNRLGSNPKLVKSPDLHFQSMPKRHLRGDAEHEFGPVCLMCKGEIWAGDINFGIKIYKYYLKQGEWTERRKPGGNIVAYFVVKTKQNILFLF